MPKLCIFLMIRNCIRSGVIRCTLFMLLYPCTICQYGIHVVLWSRIGILMRLRCRTSQQRRTFIAVLVSIRNDLANLTLYSMEWYWNALRAGPMFFKWPKLLAYFMSSIVFPLSSFVLQVGIVGLGSSNRQGLNHSYPAMHCQPHLIIIIIVDRNYLYKS